MYLLNRFRCNVGREILKNRAYTELLLNIIEYEGNQEAIVNYLHFHSKTTKENVYAMIKNISGRKKFNHNVVYSFIKENKEKRKRARGINKVYLEIDYQSILKYISITTLKDKSIQTPSVYSNPILINYLHSCFLALNHHKKIGLMYKYPPLITLFEEFIKSLHNDDTTFIDTGRGILNQLKGQPFEVVYSFSEFKRVCREYYSSKYGLSSLFEMVYNEEYNKKYWEIIAKKIKN